VEEAKKMKEAAEEVKERKAEEVRTKTKTIMKMREREDKGVGRRLSTLITAR
jgi:hypothetical protein